MLAWRYNGLKGNGRIADFVIHNEVNTNTWFNIGCGFNRHNFSNVGCDGKSWLDVYAANYNKAYDRIVVWQPTARVLVSLDNRFGGPDFDQPSSPEPVLSGMTFLTEFDKRAGTRKWHVAYHPYSKIVGSPGFSIDDYPNVTFGNLGVLAGWLRKTFPNKPHTWEIHLTESGFHAPPSYWPELEQQSAICDSFENVLGTPGIQSYIYHHMVDYVKEMGLLLGLRRSYGAAKPGWNTWAYLDYGVLHPDYGAWLACGFQDLPFIRLRRGYNKITNRHWASSRRLPPGFVQEASWRLWREPEQGTRPLFECRVGTHNLLSQDVNCEGLLPLGPVGPVWS